MTRTLLLLAGLLIPVVQFAQQLPPPAPELKKLDVLLGNWKTEGQIKPGPTGPGGAFTSTDSYEWQKGGYWLISRAQVSGAGLPDGSSLSVFGYDANRHVYTYESFSGIGGQHEVGTGRVEGDTWVWESESTTPYQWRFTEKIVSPTSLTLKFEVSADGEKWIPVLEAKSNKQ